MALLLMLGGVPLHAQAGTAGSNWTHYGSDHGSTKYAPLDQIEASNFASLEVAWTWESADKDLAEATPFKAGYFRGTPLAVDGVLYVPTGLSQIAAIDAASGRQLWVHDPQSYERGMVTHGMFQQRGLEYWTDGTAKRLFLATGGRQLVSVDAVTGKPDPDFAGGGWVDLYEDLGRAFNKRNIGHSSPVIVVGDTVVVGSIIMDFPTHNTNPPGHVRGYDARTGELRWRFQTIPQEGELGVETWRDEAWKLAGNTNVWSMMSADDELGYVYLPVGTPTSDYYGGHRHGANLFAESLIALDAATGERVWHFQAVHHGIWDYDFPCAPNLVDVEVDGRKIAAVAQVSKQGITYVFDRRTGEPVWPIVERPVDTATTVPGEHLSPTQPFPTKPPPFETLGFTEDDLIDLTPELLAEAKEIAENYVLGPIFTPSIVAGTGGKKATIVAPGAAGGANWPGAAVDPESGVLYVPSINNPSGMALAAAEEGRSDFRYMMTFVDVEGPQGLPLGKPPWRRITAIDLNRGEILWQVPFGDGPRNHPAFGGKDPGPLGTAFPRGVIAEGGLLLTKSLIITFLPQLDELGDRVARGSRLVAYDKKDGSLLASVAVERTLHGAPMTFLHQGRQMIVVAGGGRDEPAELVAFALPRAGEATGGGE